MIAWIVCAAGAYLVGSIPFGVFIGRAKGVDIRREGSKNIGASNVTRVLGKRLGMLCFALDVSKGALPVFAAGIFRGVINRTPQELSAPQMWLWLMVVFAAVLGHMCSPFLSFRGGKGVATGFGAMLAMYPVLTIPALAAMVVWYATVRLSRYVSVASMLAALSLPVWYLLLVIPSDAEAHALGYTLEHIGRASPPLVVTSLLAGLVIYKHRGNLARLRRGEEPKIGDRSGTP